MPARPFARTVSVVIAMLAWSFVAPAQQPERQPRDRAPDQPAHLEGPHDAYVPVDRDHQPTTPPLLLSRDGYVSVQVNVNANHQNIVGDAANEPSIAVDPTNPNRIAIGWRQFNTIASDFRQAGWGYTTNGGQSWTFPGVIEPGVFRSDPVLDADAGGVFYYNSLTADETLTNFWCHVYKSFDGGMTWDAGHYAYGGDKQWMTIDRTGGIGHGNIYAYWTSVYSACSGQFTRSTNGGTSFASCVYIPGDPYWGTMAVGPDGELYVAGDGFVVAKSTTVKNPASPLTFDFSRTVSLDGSMIGWGGPNPAGLGGQVWIAADRSTGPSRGYVYLLCSVERSSTADPADIMFARSIDGGNTWSSPVRINDDLTDSAWQWFGTMSVAPGGRIDVVWLDTRNDPGGYDSELYYSYSEDAGQTWSANEALSPAFDPHVGWPQQQKMGDYYDMESDDAATHLAYAATFNNEEDVYYLRISRLLRVSLPSGTPDLLMPGEPTDLTVRIIPGSETYVPGSGTLYYRYAGGAYQTAPLVSQGGDLYTATLPPATCSAAPEFYFSAEGSISGVVYLPPNAPTSVYTAGVGEFITIAADEFETDQGWTVGDTGDDATTGIWDRAAPEATTAQPGADHTPTPGTICWVTDHRAGSSAGTYDVDNGKTTLKSPVFDLSASEDVSISYWRWYSNDQGGAPNADVFVVDISSNGGSTWVNAETVGPSGSGTSGGWVYHQFNATDLVPLTSQIRLRFVASDEGSGSLVEAAIDDFRIETFECVDVYANGDLNCDGLVNAGDIPAFVLAITDPSAYAAAYPSCNRDLADINDDGLVNAGDIPDFVALLTGG